MKKLLSERVGRIDSSGIRRVFALGAELEDPVNFSIGQPGFDVPEAVKEAAIKAIRDGQNKYSQTAGQAALVERISAQMSDEFGWEKPSVLVTAGVSGGILLTFLALIDPGDEVILTDPYFVIYKHVINMLGGKCVFVENYPDFRLPVEGMHRRRVAVRPAGTGAGAGAGRDGRVRGDGRLPRLDARQRQRLPHPTPAAPAARGPAATAPERRAAGTASAAASAGGTATGTANGAGTGQRER